VRQINKSQSVQLVDPAADAVLVGHAKPAADIPELGQVCPHGQGMHCVDLWLVNDMNEPAAQSAQALLFNLLPAPQIATFTNLSIASFTVQALTAGLTPVAPALGAWLLVAQWLETGLPIYSLSRWFDLSMAQSR